MRDLVNRQHRGVFTYEKQGFDQQAYNESGGTVKQWFTYGSPRHYDTVTRAYDKGRADLVHSDGVLPTPYYAWDISTVSEPISYTSYSSSSIRRVYNGYRVTTGPVKVPYVTDVAPRVPFLPSDFKDEANSKHLAKIKDRQTNWSENLAEAHDFGKVYNQLKNLGKGILAARRGNWSAAGKHLGLDKPMEAAADGYLSWNLGIKPTVLAIEETIRSLDHFVRQEERTVKSTLTKVVDFGSANIFSQWYRSLRLVIEHSDTFRIADREAVARQRHGVDGLADALEAGYAVIPYSFAADYFVNVQQHLSTLSATRGLDWHHGYTTEVVKSEELSLKEQVNVVGEYINGVAKTWSLYPKLTGNVFSFQRKLRNDFVIPRLYVNIGLSTNQAGILSALAYKLTR